MVELISHLSEILKLCHNIHFIHIADSGDFVPETLTASFAAGATEACVEFIVTDDLIALEGNDTFTVTFDPPAGILPGTPSTATVTIIDNDGA